MLAQLAILAQHRDCGRMHLDLVGIVVLGLADHDHTAVQVDIVDVKAHGLTHPHARHSKQPEQRVIRCGG